MRKNTARISLACAALALIAAPALAQNAAREGREGRGPGGRHMGVQGKWNLTVTDGESTYPSWLAVEEKDGKMEGRFLGQAGSVGNADNVKFENNTLTFNAHGREWTGKLERMTIEGTWKSNDKQGKWVAKRSFNRVDPSGTWNIKAGDKTAVLTLKKEGRNVEGKWSQDGKDSEISQAHSMGNRLSFTVNGKEMEAVIKGDAIEGKDFTGNRDRKWAEPVALFDGKETDLANWEPMGKENHWKVIDGVLTNGKEHTENIVTKSKDFRNFKLHVEFKVPKDGNSGVYLRGRHEVQIADSFGKPIEAGGCGAMYSRVLPKVNTSKPAGEWQTYDIVFIDNYLTVVHNDQVIMDNVEVEGITGGAIDSNESDPGPIYLQGDHSQIFYRKVILTPAK